MELTNNYIPQKRQQEAFNQIIDELKEDNHDPMLRTALNTIHSELGKMAEEDCSLPNPKMKPHPQNIECKGRSQLLLYLINKDKKKLEQLNRIEKKMKGIEYACQSGSVIESNNIDEDTPFDYFFKPEQSEIFTDLVHYSKRARGNLEFKKHKLQNR
mmetsp:Transcript_4780/g.7066  ORF Transcript_4780/g.7066 Transcript_4780/m.7066 type:complete len:157 (+) Transcript_4780:783-1253(+)